MADTVDDNIFQWNVKMSKFGRDSHLFQDCQELLQKFGYDYIELQLDFSMVNSVRFHKPESSLSLLGSLPFLPAAGEGDQAQTAGQHDAAGHHHGDTEAQRVGLRQEHEECSHRH